MGNIGMTELLVVLVVALIVLGPDRLPGAARQMGRMLQDLRRMSADVQAQVRDAFDEPAEPALQPDATMDEQPVTRPIVPAPVSAQQSSPSTEACLEPSSDGCNRGGDADDPEPVASPPLRAGSDELS